MALEQRKFTSPYIHQHEHEQEIPETPQRQQSKNRRRKMFSPGEKFLYVIFASLFALVSSVLIQREGQLNDVNREVQAISHQIEQTTKQNTELSVQVKEQSTYDIIWERAKELGLNLNEKNVKVVPGR